MLSQLTIDRGPALCPTEGMGVQGRQQCKALPAASAGEGRSCRRSRQHVGLNSWSGWRCAWGLAGQGSG